MKEDKIVMYSQIKKSPTVGRNLYGFIILVLLLVSCFAPAVSAAPASPPSMTSENIKIDGIDHFTRIDTDVYRGESPTEGGLRSLSRAHIKTVICLRSEIPYSKTAQELGLRVEHIPLSSFKSPSHESIRHFLEIVSDPSAKPVFFHCRSGEDRTAVMAVIYRIQVQGWPEEMALKEMKDSGISTFFIDLKGFVLSYRQAQQQAATTVDKDARAAVKAGDRLLTAGEAQKAVPYYSSALQKNPDYMDARLGLAQALSKTGAAAQALSEMRQAMIRAGSQGERIKAARTTIRILVAASTRGDLPTYGFDIAEQEWAVLELLGAEDQESLLSLGDIFQRGLNLSRALEALDRAQIKGQFPAQNLGEQVQRIRAVHSYAPRSEPGKELGLKPRINRGELAALLIQEMRVDRLRDFQGSATWRPTLEKPGTVPVANDIAGTPHSDDIKRVLALGIRGLQPFSDQTFRPEAFVSRAEFVVIIEDMLTRATRDQTLPTQLLGKTSRFADVSTGAWYQSAADLARSLGLFAPAPGETQNFKPLVPITGLETLQAFRLLKKCLDTRSRAIVVVVDALRAESAYSTVSIGVACRT